MTRRVAGALVIAAALLLTASACSSDHARRATPTTTATTVPVVPRVLVLGDSNLFESRDAVEDALRDAGTEPTLVGVPSLGLKDLAFWREQLADHLPDAPDVVVVGLGTNDTGNSEDVERFPARLDQLMQAIGDRPVVWITHVDDRPAAPASAGRAINAAIRAAPERWPNLRVLDFTASIAADPTILSADNLHFSPAGREQWAQAIADAVVTRLEDSGHVERRIPILNVPKSPRVGGLTSGRG